MVQNAFDWIAFQNHSSYQNVHLVAFERKSASSSILDEGYLDVT